MWYRRVKLQQFLLGIAIVSIIMAASVKVIRFIAISVEKPRESVCRDNAFYIGFQLLDYRGTHGNFLPTILTDSTGRPMHSWRSVLFARIDRNFAKRYNFAEPWNSPANQQAAQTLQLVFGCPTYQDRPAKFANYAAIVTKDRSVSSLDAQGFGRPGNGPRVLLIEVPNSTIGWTEPRDVSPEEIRSLGFGHDPGGLSVVFENGRVRRLPPEVINSLLQLPSARP